MKLNDLTWKLKEFWLDFKKEKTGLIGLAILALSLLVVIFEPFCLPYKEVNKNWRNISYWEDSSAAAPPVWVNFFSSKKATKNEVITDFTEEDVNDPEFGMLHSYSFHYNYTYDISPNDILFKVQGSGSVFFHAVLVRPDGYEIDLGQYQRTNLTNADIRYSFQNDARAYIFSFAREFGASSASGSARPTDIAFSEPSKTMFRDKKALNGEYIIKILVPQSIAEHSDSQFINPHLIIVGKVSGVLGTDTQKRDIFSGIIAGLKWALFIGIITSIVSVLLGVLFGIISAYFGGFVDSAMSFLFEIVVSMPMLPVLIVISATFKPSIWIIVFALICFSWVGPVKTVRSMALQIKEETYIEAAKALGSGKWRIIFKHMTPLLLPYSFASMALTIPGTIVFEASLSLLGLGDPSIVSWGQILHDAQLSGAALNGLWWWIIPPGLLIAIMGMTFAFLGFAMDKILHPKLRTR